MELANKSGANSNVSVHPLRADKRQLEKEKDTLQLLSKGRMEYSQFLDLYGREFGIRTELEDKLSEAISVYPHLSQAISKEEPFDVGKSVKALMRKT